jgi:VanZ family protein
MAFVVSVLYAASDEYHQTFVPGRNGTPVDVGVDAVGALVALLVVGSLGRKGGRE